MRYRESDTNFYDYEREEREERERDSRDEDRVNERREERRDTFWDEYYANVNKHIDYLDKLFRKKD